MEVTKAMFAVVRTGGKQYRVAAGDKIAVEKLAGDAGDTITLGDVLLAGNGDQIAEAGSTTVAAEIIAQAKGEKVVVFKKRRRHNYRRKNGHRQQLTLLRIVQVGDDKYEAQAAAPKETEAPVTIEASVIEAAEGTDTSVDTVVEAPEPKAKKAAPKKRAADGDAAPTGEADAVAKKAAPKKPGAAKKPAADTPVADAEEK